MKVVHIVPGSGGTFYCQNCLRDAALVRALRGEGLDALVAPLYLPLLQDRPGETAEGPIFFGAINVYLQEKSALFRRTPRWLDRFLDAMPLLRWAARKAGTTRAEGLDAMTWSMLRGEEGRQAKEVRRLVEWLKEDVRPGAVHISNALLLGLAPSLKRELDVPIYCSLQDEEGWIEAMEPAWRERIWALLAEQARRVDLFTAVSDWYGGVMAKRLALPPEKLRVVPLGIDLEGYGQAPLDLDPPTLGYLSRMTPDLGLDLLFQAFLELKGRPEFAALRLRITGGQTGDDLEFIAGMKQQVAAAGLAADVDFTDELGREERLAFLRSLSLLSVPAPKGEAFGAFILESLAAGVPLVQPRAGAFPEVLAATGGGVLCEPGDPEGLAAAIGELLGDPERLRELGRRGRETVHRDFGIERMARRMAEIYRAEAERST